MTTTSTYPKALPATHRVVPEAPLITPIQDLCTVVPVTSNVVEVTVIGGTPAAAVVPEGTPVPESAHTETATTVSLDLLADFREVTRQLADDGPALMARLAKGRAVLRKAEAEAAAAIVAGTYSVGGTNASMPVAAAEAIGALVDAGYLPNAVLVGAADLGAFVDYPELFGVPVVPCAGLTGKALVGDFRTGVEVYQRGGVAAHLTDSHASNFTANVLTLLTEARQKTVVVEAAAIRETAAA